MNDEQTRTRFETLLLPLMKDAYNLTRWLMKNQEDAEDMVQESYLRAYRFFGTRPWERYSTIRRFDLKSQIRFSGGFNLLFRFLDPMSSNDPAVDLSFPGSRFR